MEERDGKSLVFHTYPVVRALNTSRGNASLREYVIYVCAFCLMVRCRATEQVKRDDAGEIYRRPISVEFQFADELEVTVETEYTLSA